MSGVQISHTKLAIEMEEKSFSPSSASSGEVVSQQSISIFRVFSSLAQQVLRPSANQEMCLLLPVGWSWETHLHFWKVNSNPIAYPGGNGYTEDFMGKRAQDISTLCLASIQTPVESTSLLSL